MNTRLQKLYDQALFHNNRYATQEEFAAAFAQLIVAECIAKYNEWAEHSTDKTSFVMAQHNVKKHFGVEP